MTISFTGFGWNNPPELVYIHDMHCHLQGCFNTRLLEETILWRSLLIYKT